MRHVVCAGHREIVSEIQQDTALRRLYVLTSVGDQPIVVTFLMFAVITVEPALADVGGGTELTMTTEGVPDLGVMKCYFAGGITTDVEWVSTSSVKCMTPEVNTTSESCAGEVCGAIAGAMTRLRASCTGHSLGATVTDTGGWVGGWVGQRPTKSWFT